MAFDTQSADVTIYQYADCSEGWTFLDANGNPLDFSGATARCGLRVLPTDLAPMIFVSTTPTAAGVIVFGSLTNGLPLGTVLVTWAHAANALITATQLRGDLLVTWGNGIVDELVRITATVVLGSTY